MSAALRVPHCTLPPECERLRGEVREFLDRALAHMTPRERAESWNGFDTDFSRKLGARGWIGMTWSASYGGHERSFLERYVVSEELLAAGAPVAAHWIADRQSAQQILAFGSESQKRQLLPGIARGELFFAIGMSEPDSGSDLASLRSRARRVERGWLLDGRKVWTSNAHRVQYLIGLFRTSGTPQDRHAGLSQFLVDLRTPGISIRPIVNLAGDHHFNEITFEEVLLPAENLLGVEGEGWQQVNHELAFERSGPERYLSSVQVLVQMIDAASADNQRHGVGIGRAVSQACAIRQLSLGIAGMLARGDDPGVAAAILKELGTNFEQSLPALAHELFDFESPAALASLEPVVTYVMQIAPSFSLRGGTREVVRGIIARALGLR